MFPIGSFDRMESDLRTREYEKGTDIPITVGILIADFRRQFCKENIFDQLERLDKKSGPLIDFYIPGYCMTTEIDEHDMNAYKFKNKTYSFSSELFDDFRENLEHRKVEITGHAQLILFPYTDGRLAFDDAMIFDLEQDELKGKTKSTKLFFDFIFKIAGQTTQFEDFRRKTNLDRVKNISLCFIKEHLPGALISLLISLPQTLS